MDEREKRKKVILVIAGIVVLGLLFLLIKSCTNKNVEEDYIKITNIDITSETVTLVVEESQKLTYSVLPSNNEETVKWVTSDESVVSVDSSGNLVALKAGNAIVTLASSSGVSDYIVVKVASKTTVDGDKVTVALTEKESEIKVGSSKKLYFELDPATTKYDEVIWESSNNLVATVTSDGVVEGIRSGVTTITLKVMFDDGTTIVDKMTLTVEEKATLYMTTSVETIYTGETVRLSAAISDTSISAIDGNVTSSKTNIASVSNISVDGIYLNFDVKGLKKGSSTLKLSVTASDGATIALDLPVEIEEYTDLYISSGDKEIEVNEAFILNGRMEPSVSGSLDTTCSSSNTAVASVTNSDATGIYNGACQITGLKEGKSNITISIGGFEKTIKITVSAEAEEPDEPDDPTKTLTSMTATLSKPEYKVNEAIGVLNVVANYSDGSSRSLTNSDCIGTTATGEEYCTTPLPFDTSTASPSNNFIVLYYYHGETKQVTITYVVVEDETTNPSTSGGSSTSGGGGYSSGKSENANTLGINDTTGVVWIDDTKSDKDAFGNYVGDIALEVDIQSGLRENTTTVLVELTCADGVTPCTKENAISARIKTIDVKDGNYSEIIDDANGNVTYYVGIMDDAHALQYKVGEDFAVIDMTDTTLKETLMNVLNVAVLSKDKDSAGKTTVDGIVVSVNNKSANSAANTSASGTTLTISATKAWYSSLKMQQVPVIVKITLATGDVIKELYRIHNGTKYDFTNPPVATKNFNIPIEEKGATIIAVIEQANGLNTLLRASVSWQVDGENPTCTVSTLKQTTSGGYYVDFSTSDKTSGIDTTKTITTLSRIAGSGELSDIPDTISSYKYAVTESGDKVLTVTDKAGNTGTCSLKVDPFTCYRSITCGSIQDTKSLGQCAQCIKGGCMIPSVYSIHVLAECTSSTDSTAIPEKYWFDLGLDQDGKLKTTMTVADIGSLVGKNQAGQNVIFDKCTVLANASDYYPTDNTKCLTKGTRYSATDANLADNETIFYYDCKNCGCMAFETRSETEYFAANWSLEKQQNSVSSNALRLVQTGSSTKSDCSIVGDIETSYDGISNFWPTVSGNG